MYKICLFHTPLTFKVHEDCITMYGTERTNFDQLTCLIKDVIFCAILFLHQCRSRCYDGAANKSGRTSGLSTQIQRIEP